MATLNYEHLDETELKRSLQTSSLTARSARVFGRKSGCPAPRIKKSLRTSRGPALVRVADVRPTGAE